MAETRPSPHADLSLVAEANRAHREGRLEDALALYRQAIVKMPELRALLSPNVDRTSRRLHAARVGLPVAPAAAAPVRGRAYEQFCRDSYEAFVRAQPALARLPAKADTLPLVSVVMTTFNAADTVLESIEAILNQDYPNIEVVVCDDASTDTTWELLQALQRRCKPVRVMRLNSNYGTYLAKNTAVRHASGEFLLFQDSDDLSHPARVRVQVTPLLADDKLMATRTKYLRYREDDGEIVPIAGLASKFGLITLAVRRRAFREIGYFDAVRRGGDDEWYQRLLHIYGERCLKSQDVTLYAARLRADSLVADMIVFRDDGRVDQVASPPRWEYVQTFRARFKQNERDFFGTARFPPFPLRPQKNYPPSIAALPIAAEKVYASVCSIPSRQAALQSTLSSLYHQVDRIFLYLDNYERVPDFVLPMRRITVLRSGDFPGLRDNGKFLMYNETVRENKGAPFYWFTCDDDIVYPSDYVNTMIRSLAHFENRVVAGLHGVVVEEQPRKYFRNRYVYHYEFSALPHPRLVNNLGTGTVAFRSNLFGSIDPYGWPQGGMVDIFFGVLCARNGIPMACVPRHAGWLKTLAETGDTPNLMDEFRNDDSAIVATLQTHGPWGLRRIRQCLEAFDGPLRDRLEAALPAFSSDVGVQFNNYRNYLPGQPG
jgi:glycosyltransferase involved in cell wall biosynthesis